MPTHRRCCDCGSPLSRYSNGTQCQRCSASPSRALVPQHLLTEQAFCRALADGDWQTVLTSIVHDTGVTQTALSTATGVSQPHLSRLMNGQAQEPGIKTIRALCDGLGIPRQLAGLAPTEDDTDRRQALEAGARATGLAMLSAFGVPTGGSNVDQTHLAEVTSVLRKLEQHTPTRALLSSAVAHAELARNIRSRADTAAQTRRLSGVESEAAGFAAWLYADLDEQANARRFYRLSIKAAAMSGNPLLACYMRGSFGQFATNVGAAAQGRQLLAQTRARLPRSAPPIATLWLDALEASACAQLGDRSAMMLLDNAERRLSRHSNTEAVWPWLFHFDEPKLAGYRAVAAGRLGLYKSAQAAFAVAEQTGASPKQRALSTVAKAATLAATGSVDQACQLAAQALATGRRLGSERVIRAVSFFRSALGTHETSAVAQLDAAVAVSYEEDL